MKNRGGRTLFALTTAGALLAGCGSLSLGGPRRARPDLVDLADRVRALEAKVAAQELEIQKLRAGSPPAPSAASRSAAATAPTPGDVRTTATFPPPLPEPRIPPAGAVESSDIEDLALTPPGDQALESAEIPRAEQEAYDAAAALYRAGQSSEAEAAFQRFLAAHPDGSLADNALFWIGAARLGRKEIAGAEEAFRRVVELYPEGNKVPDALLKLGVCRELAGDPAGAAAVLRTLIERFPGSEAATLATRRSSHSAP